MFQKIVSNYLIKLLKIVLTSITSVSSFVNFLKLSELESNKLLFVFILKN